MLRFNLERLNHLEFVDASIPPPNRARATCSSLISSIRSSGAFWRPGHIIGYEHTFIAALAEFLACLSRDE